MSKETPPEIYLYPGQTFFAFDLDPVTGEPAAASHYTKNEEDGVVREHPLRIASKVELICDHSTGTCQADGHSNTWSCCGAPC